MERIIRRRNLFMNTSIMCILLLLAFKFSSEGIRWFWSDQPQVAVVLFVAGIVLAAFWVRSQKQ